MTNVMCVLAMKAVYWLCFLRFYKTLNALTGLMNTASILFIEDSWRIVKCMCGNVY